MKEKSQIIKIKDIGFVDIDRFLGLFKVSVKTQFPEYPIKTKRFFLEKIYTKKNLKQWLKKKTVTILIAISNLEIVGYLIANPSYGGVSCIVWLAVKDSFQKKGIGSALLKKYESIVKKQGVHMTLLLVTNKKNFKFYKKNGYKLGGYIPKSYFGIDNWWFYKKLQDPKISF